MNSKKITGFFLIIILLISMYGCNFQIFEKHKEKVSVYLWNTDLMNEYAPYLQSQLPDIDIEFVVGNNDLDYYKFLNDNGALPDIITTRRFSLYDVGDLQNNLLDLSCTQSSGSIHLTYFSNQNYVDDTIYWLPICGVVDNFIINTSLFDKYDIPIPTDYESFVSACDAFEKHSIRGFVSDFVYDYTCMEILQGLSISELSSLEGQNWRYEYEDPISNTIGLDDEVWPGVFERMEKFIKDVHLKPEDIQLDYGQVYSMFTQEKVAMIRGTGANATEFCKQGMKAEVLPYFCSDGESWLLTYPSLYVALNKNLAHDENRKEAATRVLRVMLSEEGQNTLSQNNDTISYSKNVELEMADNLDCLKPYIESNHLYIRMASNDFFAASKDVVQKMLTGEYNAKHAYKAFDAQLRQQKEDTSETVASFTKEIPYEFEKQGGNPAASAVANTLREYYGTDLLISPAYNFTGPVLNTDYNEKMLGYMIASNFSNAYVKEMTGAEIKELIKASVKGIDDDFSPFNLSTLPVISGASIEVLEKDGKFSLSSVLIGGEEIDNKAVYSVAYLNPVTYFYNMISTLYGESEIDTFNMHEKHVRDEWTEYIGSGNPISEPTDYITVK